MNNKYVFSNHQTSAKILNNKKRFPIGKVYCVGRNYLSHIRELNNKKKVESHAPLKPV